MSNMDPIEKTGMNPGAGKMLKWTGGAQVPVYIILSHICF
jgi:hypothetical protein